MKLYPPCALIFCLAAVLSSCQPRLYSEPYFPEAPSTTARPAKRNNLACADWRNYLPDSSATDGIYIRYLRVNVHILDNASGNAHRPADSCRAYVHRLLDAANERLSRNERSWRSPEGTEVLPKMYRYVLSPQAATGDDGIYFHYDDQNWYFVSQGKNLNNSSRTVVDKYAVGADSILNIFIQVHPPDSIRSPYYRANGQGIALGTALKMAGLLESKEPPENFAGLLNHEIGHILGLSHAWMEDGCPDTDNHPNKCWTWTETPPCRDMATNNMMDYNAYQQSMTPCQIGRVQYTFSNLRHPIRACLVRDWCTLQPEKTIVVRDSVAWTGARDLQGHLIVAEGGTLYLSCRVSMPPGAQIVVQPGGRLWLDGAYIHNDCGKTWQGILVQKKGELRGAVYQIKPATLENIAPEKQSTGRPQR